MRSPPLTLRALGAAVLLVTVACLAEENDGVSASFQDGASLPWGDDSGEEFMEIATGQDRPYSTNSFQQAISTSKEGGLDLDSKPGILTAQDEDWAMKQKQSSDYELPKPKISLASLLEDKKKRKRNAFSRAARRIKRRRKRRKPRKAQYVVAKAALLKRPGYTWQCVHYRRGYFKALKVAKSHKTYSEYAYKARAKARHMRMKLAKVERMERKYGRKAGVKKAAMPTAMPTMLLQQETPPWSKEADVDQMDSLNQMEISLKEDMQAEASMIHDLQSKGGQKVQAAAAAAELGLDDDKAEEEKRMADIYKFTHHEKIKKAPAPKKKVVHKPHQQNKHIKHKFAAAPKKAPIRKKKVAQNKHILWAIDHSTAKVYFTASTNPFPASPFFSNSDSLKSWKHDSFAPKLAQLSSAGSKVWGVSPSGDVYRRTANAWVKVAGRQMRRVSVTKNQVWGVDPTDNIFVLSGTHGSWKQVAGKLRLVEASGDDVWGLNKLGAIYYRHGLTGTWQLVPGGLKHLSIAGKKVWGIDGKGNVFHRHGIGGKWQRVSGQMKHISVDSHGTVWAINMEGELMVRDGADGHWTRHLAGVKGTKFSHITASYTQTMPVAVTTAPVSPADEIETSDPTALKVKAVKAARKRVSGKRLSKMVNHRIRQLKGKGGNAQERMMKAWEAKGPTKKSKELFRKLTLSKVNNGNKQSMKLAKKSMKSARRARALARKARARKARRSKGAKRKMRMKFRRVHEMRMKARRARPNKRKKKNFSGAAGPAAEMRFKAREARVLAVDILKEKKAKARSGRLHRAHRQHKARLQKAKRVSRRMSGREKELRSKKKHAKAAKIAKKLRARKIRQRKRERKVKGMARNEQKAKNNSRKWERQVKTARKALNKANKNHRTRKEKARKGMKRAREMRSKARARRARVPKKKKGNEKNLKYAMKMRAKAREARTKLNNKKKKFNKNKKSKRRWTEKAAKDLVRRERRAKAASELASKKLRRDLRGGWRERRGKRARARLRLRQRLLRAKAKAKKMARLAARWMYKYRLANLSSRKKKGRAAAAARKKAIAFKLRAADSRVKSAAAKRLVRSILLRVKQIRGQQARSRKNEKLSKRAVERRYKGRKLRRRIGDARARALRDMARAREMKYKNRSRAARAEKRKVKRLRAWARNHRAAEMKKKLRARQLLRQMREVRQKSVRQEARELRGKKARERNAKKTGRKKDSRRLLRKIQLALRARRMRSVGINVRRKDRANEKRLKGKVKELTAKVRELKGRQWKKKFDYSKIQRKFCIKWAWVRIEDYHKKKKMIKNRWRPSGPRHAGKVPIKNIVHRILKVEMTVTLVRNVLHLKAYCLGAHRKLLSMKRSSQLSALGHFLYRFGKKKGGNNVGEYVALYRSFMKYYTNGIDKYLIDRLHKSMQDKSGILKAGILPFRVEGIRKAKPAMMLKHHDLGLETLPRMFVKMALPVSKYQSLLRTVRKTNKITVASAQFEADGCRCTGRPSKAKSAFLRNLGKTCKKWFGYDKKPWCFVNPKCHGAIKAADGGLFKYC